ncbi:hypothetical protein GJ496_006551 [Pomphorhynchus laevis]|nr:hypothetical protein GJ496_006551 [Pomphorhynchus laevis]
MPRLLASISNIPKRLFSTATLAAVPSPRCRSSLKNPPTSLHPRLPRIAYLPSTTIAQYLSTMSAADHYQRLPRNPLPIHYNLTFEPDLENFVFNGHANINFKVGEELSSFSIYSTELEIDQAFITDGKATGSNEIKRRSVKVSKEPFERILLVPEEKLLPGSYWLDIKFKGILNDKMNGFYRSTYKSNNGINKVMALTQFEPVFARRAFPSWDEPSFKATFDVSIIAPSDQTVLSNMPIKKEEMMKDKPTLKQVWFDRSPKMSTYLLAFVIGDLGFTETKDSNGVQVRVFTRRGCEEQGRFSLEVASKVLPYYAEYFDIKYPLPKVDLVAVPDFAAGAMENWGLITYRDTALLVDPENTSKAAKQYVALVVGHELAHQWFGNLVTMDWWTDLWLNEGFASWIEFLSVDSLFPNLDIWTQFVFLDMKRAFDLDGLRSSHPIEVEVKSPDEIDQIFDSISYSKGASIIRMLHDFMGNEAFKQGLQTYLKQFQYANAETKDLWHHLSKAADKNIGEVMKKWTQVMGYPIVEIKSMTPVGNDMEICLSQKRFVADGKPYSDNLPWRIPISIRFASDPQTIGYKFVFSDSQSKVIIPNAAKEKWIKFNADSVGFYITRYPNQLLEPLISSVKLLTNLDRFGLQSELNMLCKAGLNSYVDYLKLCQSYSSYESDYTVWRDIASNIGGIRVLVDQIDKVEVTNKMNNYEISILRPVYEKHGWLAKRGEDDLTAMLRSVLIRNMGLAGDPEIIKECVRMFESNGQIDPNVRSAVYSVVAHSDSKYLDEMMRRHQMSDLSEEKNRLLGAMGLVKDKIAKRRVLDYTMGEHVRNQDVFYGYTSVANADKEGRWITWEFFKEHIKVLSDRYKDSNMMSSLIKRSFNEFCDEKAIEEIKAFFEKHPQENAGMAINQVLENIATNIQAFRRDSADIEKYLNDV